MITVCSLYEVYVIRDSALRRPPVFRLGSYGLQATLLYE